MKNAVTVLSIPGRPSSSPLTVSTAFAISGFFAPGGSDKLAPTKRTQKQMCVAVMSVWNILQPGIHIDREYVDTPIYILKTRLPVYLCM